MCYKEHEHTIYILRCWSLLSSCLRRSRKANKEASFAVFGMRLTSFCHHKLDKELFQDLSFWFCSFDFDWSLVASGLVSVNSQSHKAWSSQERQTETWKRHCLLLDWTKVRFGTFSIYVPAPMIRLLHPSNKLVSCRHFGIKSHSMLEGFGCSAKLVPILVLWLVDHGHYYHLIQKTTWLFMRSNQQILPIPSVKTWWNMLSNERNEICYDCWHSASLTTW